MSYVKKQNFLNRLMRVRSIKGFAQNFLLGNMAGQKLFLYNKRLPRVINISFNEKTCMYSCKMCPYSEQEVRSHYRHASEMDFETLKRIVDAVPNDPYYSFDISAVGETLEFPQLAEFIAYMKREKPLVNTIISTNVMLLTPEMAQALFAAAAWIPSSSAYMQRTQRITSTSRAPRPLPGCGRTFLRPALCAANWASENLSCRPS